ncbi:hypothetical protein EFP84_03795 [Leptospira kmetyi]|uniref:Uncharacterized protein n=1 Tax=Leptospira kmetyi TaxID=408139 RepID=A0AAD0UN01_9LEPT|nr:hypothetical protein EFP84_03795 [Leptospira kmetyi]
MTRKSFCRNSRNSGASLRFFWIGIDSSRNPKTNLSNSVSAGYRTSFRFYLLSMSHPGFLRIFFLHLESKV